MGLVDTLNGTPNLWTTMEGFENFNDLINNYLSLQILRIIFHYLFTNLL